MAKCAGCGEVDKHPLLAAVSGTAVCRKCGRQLALAGAVIEALDEEAAKPSGGRFTSPLSLQGILLSGGLSGALAAINATVPHRYTGIFVKEGALLRNVALHDKQTPHAELWEPFPVGNSFCSIVIGSGDPLRVREARSDVRNDVSQHPAGAIVQAYCGVPFIDDAGNVLGTLCHFDEAKSDWSVDLVAMLQIPRVLRDYLPASNRPAG
jgi:GAF domain-containing protein